MEKRARYVVIATTDHPDYAWYVPVVRWAWAQFGWEVICLDPVGIPGYRAETIAQCIRLYAADLFAGEEDAVLMTSDADMIPLSDYWAPAAGAITVYGRDLTETQVPICYVAMSAAKWRDVMRLTGDVRGDMARDLAGSLAKSAVRLEWWCVDQDLITERLDGREVVRVDRGFEGGTHIARGRVDRFGMKVPETLIDFHAPKEPMRHRAAIHAVLLRAFGARYAGSEIAEYVSQGVTAQEQLDRYAAEDQWGFLRPFTSEWDRHRPLLYLGLCLTRGRVVEMGSDESSTPLLRAYCRERELAAYDSDAEWEPCSLLFVSGAPGEQRHRAIAAARDTASIVVLRDSEAWGASDYPVWGQFRYALHMNRKGGGAGTSMVSNVIDVSVYAGLRFGEFQLDAQPVWRKVLGRFRG